MRSLAGLAILLGVCALFLAGCSRLTLFKRNESAKPSSSGPAVGTVAPEIEGTDLDGQHFKLSDCKGKVVVVVFWASWCKPCCELIPCERELAQRHRGKPFVMVGVNVDDNPELARKVMVSQGMTWPIVPTGGWENPIIERWQVKWLPSVFVLDAKGVIRRKNLHGNSLDEAVTSLLAEKAS